MISHSQQEEINKFNQDKATWWDLAGPFRTLHEINPCRVDFIKQHCKIQAKQILDIGCGAGILCESLAKHGGHITGVDLSEGAIDAAREHATENNLSIQYYRENIEDFTFEHQNLFDVVTCLELLEHVDDPAAIVKAAALALKPAGYLFFSSINRNLSAYVKAIVIAEYVLRLLPMKTHDYEKCIRPSELDKWARDSGLRLIDIKGISYNPFTKKASLSKDVSVNYLAVYQKNA